MPTTEDSGSTGTGALLRLRELLDLLDRGAPAEAFRTVNPPPRTRLRQRRRP